MYNHWMFPTQPQCFLNMGCHNILLSCHGRVLDELPDCCLIESRDNDLTCEIKKCLIKAIYN